MDMKKLKGHINYNYFEITVSADAERHTNSISMEDLELAVENYVFLNEISSISKEDRVRIQGFTGNGKVEMVISTKPLTDPNSLLGRINKFLNTVIFSHIAIASALSVPGGFRYYGIRRTHYVRILEVHKVVEL